MNNDLVTICPRCQNNLIATQLSCENCELELKGSFPLNKFDYLSKNERDFIESFLKFQGNFKSVQLERDMSYPAVKKMFNEILNKLNITTIKKNSGSEPSMIEELIMPINKSDSIVVQRIKEKLNKNKGKASIPLYNGEFCDIGYDSKGNGLISPKIPPANQLTWEVFDAAYEIVVKNGGKVMKGKARSGAKLGSDNLPLDSVEGYIAYKVHGAQIGDTAFGPGFVIAAVLDWVGICKNERGFITINSGLNNY